MATQDLAESLLRMLNDSTIALAVRGGDLNPLADLKLSETEKRALTEHIERWQTGLLEVGTVGAWSLVTKDLGSVHKATKDALNKALALRQTMGGSIPVTGS